MGETLQFIVKMVFEEAPGKNELKEHAREALKHWGGQNPPDCVMFPTNIKKVTVGKVTLPSENNENN